MQATRERIIEAAVELYAELGISATTMSEIARRADVAPGTLRNHFRSRDDLDRAMVERLTDEAPLPELSIFDGARSIEERLERLLRVTGRLFDQIVRIQRMWLQERLLTAVWTETGAAYGARWEQLIRVAPGSLADDLDALALIRAVLEPSFFDRVRGGTRSTDEVSALIAAAITPWFAARAVEREVSPQRTR
jgi:AcrR family transcriptional regulator